MTVTFRPATLADAEAIGLLHADSWRRFYRGAYSDSYLDGDVDRERVAVWRERMADLAGKVTIVAEDENGFAGFAHTALDHDPEYGSLLDNLHVPHDRQRSGIGRALLIRSAEAVVAQAKHPALYLWVLEQNVKAQAFYRSLGGEILDGRPVTSQPPENLNGTPIGLRVVWPDATTVK